MEITRIFAGPDGRSHFETLEIALTDNGSIGRLSSPVDATSVIFRETDATYDYDWHPAPRRQFIILLDGNIEITTGDGETRRFTGGDVLLVEDTSGSGHRTRTTDGKARRSIFVTLD